MMKKLFGARKWTYHTLGAAEFIADLPEKSYPVKVTLMESLLKRVWDKKILERCLYLKVAPQEGIPYRFDKTGVRATGLLRGFSVKLDALDPDWRKDAKTLVEAWVMRERHSSK